MSVTYLSERGIMSKAFTLSEILITLGIIGVISAITIPTLVNDIQDKHFKALWKKTYSDVSNAYELVNQDAPIYVKNQWGGVVGDLTLISKQAYYGIFSRLNTTSFCVKDYLDRPCTDDKNWNHHVACNSLIGDSDTCAWDKSGGYAFLTNGVRIYAHGYLWGYPMLLVDVNGDKKPNIVGRDMFVIYIRDKIIPAGAQGYEAKGCDKNIKSNSGFIDAVSKSGSGCGYKYLYE